MEPAVETELKVKCDDFELLRAAHPELGWDLVAPRHFEDNFVFDLPAQALSNRGSILRLRVAAGRATLTYKGLTPESDVSELKVREELETEVADPDTLTLILERLGLRRSFRYQKYRTIYRIHTSLGDALAMRDETPFGDFLEIEGEAATVLAAAGIFEISPKHYVRESYIGIQAALCAARGVPLQDLLFEPGRD